MAEAAALPIRRAALDDRHASRRGESGAVDRRVVLTHVPHTAKITLRGNPSDANFMTAAGRVLDMVLPADPLTSVSTTLSHGLITVLNLGPDEWLITGDPGAETLLCAELTDALADIHAAVVDVTENSTVLRVTGPSARDVLAKGLPLNIQDRRFPVGAVAQSLLVKADVILHRREDVEDGPAMDIYVRRSFAEYLWAWLLDAGGEYGVDVLEARSTIENDG